MSLPSNKEDILLLKKMISSPIFFIEKMWNLTPQPLICTKIDHQHTKTCFGPFVKGKHITWQQWTILRGIELSLEKKAPKRISVRSGHGIGKDTLLSWIIHWYLFTHIDAQIGCTAPSTNQMYDVLWKELSIWHYRLPPKIQENFEWTTTHYKIKERPESWWARARTARKEAPEAFAGLHGKYVMLIGDEASGIPDEIYRTGEGSLTGENTLVILVGNPTRLEGYFYDTHNKDKKNWQCFQFSGEDSPIVEDDYVARIVTKFGKDSDEYRYMVQGEFPKAEGMDKGGWMPLLQETDIKYCATPPQFRKPKMGIDPAGEGANKTAHVIRDEFFAKIGSLEEISNPKSIAERTLTLMTHYDIPVEKCIVDNFGEGANVGIEMAMVAGRVEAINVGDEAKDKERFYNKRAELYWMLREWVIAGGQLVKHDDWKQLLTIKYKRTHTGRIQIMSKAEMKDKYGYESPDCADALALTFHGENRFGRGMGITNVYMPSWAGYNKRKK